MNARMLTISYQHPQDYDTMLEEKVAENALSQRMVDLSTAGCIVVDVRWADSVQAKPGRTK